ncbi:MAG TPA: sulfite exporter TauE/SafE family protein [Candidatus Saccharimonadales bacterium]|nr:sulfite exporter TauE/SafE family protein [Candidatus Saccharimonadales bacterium]
MEHIIILAIVNLLASTLSGAAGGGAGFVSGAPLLIVLGLTPAQAVATTRFGGLGISAGASSRFFRERITDKRSLVIFSVIGAVGSVIGSLALLHLKSHAHALQEFMGLLILIVGIPSLYVRKVGLKPVQRPKWVQAVGYVLMFLATILVAAVATGIGSLQTIMLIYFFGMTALVASATRRILQLIIAVFSLIVYIPSGLIDYPLAITALLTSFIGGFLGAHIAIKKGDQFVLNLFALVSLLLALQLIFGK